MTEVFQRTYAETYDLLYADKDYEAECDLLERIFREFGSAPPTSILDLGCGSGGHSIPLAQRGYQVTGVDVAPDMLERARDKDVVLDGGGSARFLEGDARSLALSQRFDVCLAMFAVLGYQWSNDDVQATLAGVARHLKPGGLFVFDIWYGPAVLTIRPSERMKSVEQDGRRVIRFVQSSLDLGRHACETHYWVLVLEDNRLVEETTETHVMRYFFPLELDALLSHAGLERLELRRFPEFDRPPDEASWNAMGVARRA